VKQVVVYTRAGCHLCDEALATLRDLQTEFSFELSELDIEEDDALLARYHWIIPVISLDGREIARAPISESALRQALA
jgi:glutaredoxin